MALVNAFLLILADIAAETPCDAGDETEWESQAREEEFPEETIHTDALEIMVNLAAQLCEASSGPENSEYLVSTGVPPSSGESNKCQPHDFFSCLCLGRQLPGSMCTFRYRFVDPGTTAFLHFKFFRLLPPEDAKTLEVLMSIMSRLMEQQEPRYSVAALELLGLLLQDEICRPRLGNYVGSVSFCSYCHLGSSGVACFINGSNRNADAGAAFL